MCCAPCAVYDAFGPARGVLVAAHFPVLGTVIGCLRKVQQWNLASIFSEYRRYAGSKMRSMNEQFIELFDTDLVRIPPKTWPLVKE